MVVLSRSGKRRMMQGSEKYVAQLCQESETGVLKQSNLSQYLLNTPLETVPALAFHFVTSPPFATSPLSSHPRCEARPRAFPIPRIGIAALADDALHREAQLLVQGKKVEAERLDSSPSSLPAHCEEMTPARQVPE